MSTTKKQNSSNKPKAATTTKKSISTNKQNTASKPKTSTTAKTTSKPKAPTTTKAPISKATTTAKAPISTNKQNVTNKPKAPEPEPTKWQSFVKELKFHLFGVGYKSYYTSPDPKPREYYSATPEERAKYDEYYKTRARLIKEQEEEKRKLKIPDIDELYRSFGKERKA